MWYWQQNYIKIYPASDVFINFTILHTVVQGFEFYVGKLYIQDGTVMKQFVEI